MNVLLKLTPEQAAVFGSPLGTLRQQLLLGPPGRAADRWHPDGRYTEARVKARVDRASRDSVGRAIGSGGRTIGSKDSVGRALRPEASSRFFPCRHPAEPRDPTPLHPPSLSPHIPVPYGTHGARRVVRGEAQVERAEERDVVCGGKRAGRRCRRSFRARDTDEANAAPARSPEL